MIDIEKEQLLTMKQLQALLPVKRGLQAVRRWGTCGITVRTTGRKVYMDTILLGSERYTSMEAYRRFIAALNEEE